jgi:lipoate-protein ligase A
VLYFQVQIIGMLCRTPTKEKRYEILRRSAGGGGVFDTESGGKLTIPSANLNNIATQADNLLEV